MGRSKVTQSRSRVGKNSLQPPKTGPPRLHPAGLPTCPAQSALRADAVGEFAKIGGFIRPSLGRPAFKFAPILFSKHEPLLSLRSKSASVRHVNPPNLEFRLSDPRVYACNRKEIRSSHLG
jgi:hypothetical protein